MVISVKTIRCFSLLVIMALSWSGMADERLIIRRSVVDLSDSRITDQITLEMLLADTASFDVTVSAPGYGCEHDNNFFYLQPTGRKGKPQQVKVALDLPYKRLTPGGPYRRNSHNTVVRQNTRNANDGYSSCPVDRNSTSTKRVCKPLSFLVVDMESEPNATYTTQLTVTVTDSSGKTLTQTVDVTYKNTKSKIGIYSFKDRLELKPRNYTDSSQFCVFSQNKKNFSVRLEGEKKGKQFLLAGQGKSTLPYNARVYLNKSRHSEEARPDKWIKGGIPIQARAFQDCHGDRNLKVEAYLTPQDIAAADPGNYTGTLTVRVKAQ